MLPFDARAVCPKCGFQDVFTQYCPGRLVQTDCSLDLQHEHLHRSCARCDYLWPEQCLTPNRRARLSKDEAIARVFGVPLRPYSLKLTDAFFLERALLERGVTFRMFHGCPRAPWSEPDYTVDVAFLCQGSFSRGRGDSIPEAIANAALTLGAKHKFRSENSAYAGADKPRLTIRRDEFSAGAIAAL